MQTSTRLLVLTSALALAALGASAQMGGGPGEPPRDRPKPPLEAALDANGDGVIDAIEIANAPAALKKLDKNGDGKLTADEYRPQRPMGGPQSGMGGPGGSPPRS